MVETTVYWIEVMTMAIATSLKCLLLLKTHMFMAEFCCPLILIFVISTLVYSLHDNWCWLARAWVIQSKNQAGAEIEWIWETLVSWQRWCWYDLDMTREKNGDALEMIGGDLLHNI